MHSAWPWEPHRAPSRENGRAKIRIFIEEALKDSIRSDFIEVAMVREEEVTSSNHRALGVRAQTLGGVENVNVLVAGRELVERRPVLGVTR